MRTAHSLAAACLLLAAATSCSAFFEDSTPVTAEAEQESLYALTVNSLDGKATPLADYEGKVALVVNTASKCGFTPQYEGLQELSEQYADEGLVVLGFPSGDFRNQEFESASEIAQFCTENYGVTFPLFERSGVKAGPEQSPVFNYLGAATGSLPGWNFGKYLVDRDGHAIAFFDTRVAPDAPELRTAIEAALGS
jgi:glutathione peroxidase